MGYDLPPGKSKFLLNLYIAILTKRIKENGLARSTNLEEDHNLSGTGKGFATQGFSGRLLKGKTKRMKCLRSLFGTSPSIKFLNQSLIHHKEGSELSLFDRKKQ